MAEIIVQPSIQPDVKTGVTLVHGLLTGGNESWSEKLTKWGNENTEADFSRLQYWEGLLGFGHQKHIDTLAGLLKNELSQWSEVGYQHAIGHSNGSRLILECLLQNPEFVLGDVHLIAAWAPRDCRRHINIILKRKQARRIFLYVSRKDEILCWSIMWAFYWGFTLGKDGPTNVIFSPPNGPAINVAADHPFTILDPSSTYPIQIGRDDTMKHGTWVNPRNANDPGFNLAVMDKILSLSINVSKCCS